MNTINNIYNIDFTSITSMDPENDEGNIEYKYKLINLTPETISKRMADREFVSQMADRVIYRKAYDKVKELVSIKTKKVTVENYFKHVNEHKAEHGE